MDKGTKHKGLGHRDVRGPRRQRGAVLALVAVGMLAIIGMAGLALQSGHLFVDKTHLQNALDAAALSAAKTLNNDGTVAQAEAAGQDAFDEHVAAAAGASTFVERELRDSTYTLSFEFSATLDPFVGGADETDDPPATFVRARATGFTMDTWLANVLPGVGDEQDIGGTAVAGPAPIDTTPGNRVCDIAPIMMCGDAADTDTDCSDGACFGYHPADNEEVRLKTHSGRYNGEWEVGPGNYQLIRLGCPGGDCVRENLAGGYSGCLEDETVPTQPGNQVGPVSQGFNTRFGIYQGGMSSTDYPADTVTYSQPEGADTNPDPAIGTCTFCYDDYVDRQTSEQFDYPPMPDGTGVAERRVMPVPIGDCTGTTNGQGDVRVLGLGCFFMTRPVTHAGNTQEIFGQLVGDCQADGPIATTPPPAGGGLLYRIVLYKDPDSRDS
ncbi:MAG: pilus assembly protein TadG-related protein [Gammaproteobacteria bacterium]